MRKKLFTFVILFFFCSLWAQAQSQFEALLFTKTEGWHHDSIKEGVEAVQWLAARHNFSVDWEEEPFRINPENLEKYEVIIFLNTTGDILNEDQQNAMKNFIQSGKGFVGVHSASDTEKDWEWFTRLVGRIFYIHPAIQTAKIDVVEPGFPGLEQWPAYRWTTDEWYEFGEELSPNLNYLITLDESTFDPVTDWGDKKGEGMGDFHPIAWYQEFDGGRSFYTNLGHKSETYADEMFLEHLFGGILWAATGKGW